VRFDALLERWVAVVFAGSWQVMAARPVYVSFGMDGFDASVAPCVCTPTRGGASLREGFAVLAACAGRV